MTKQAAFLDAVKAPEIAVPDGLEDGASAPAGKRFNVYRNNVAVALTEALEVGFPVLRKLIGAENFKKVAALFWRAHPPDSPVLAQYGARLPAFLSDFAPLAKYPYLADVARLEMALRESYHAADAAPTDTAILGQMDAETLTSCRFELAPSLRLVRSAYPVFGIWRFNTEEGAPKPAPKAEDVLVVRREFDPVPHLLGPGMAEALTALAAGRNLGDAHAEGAAISSEFDLGGLLSLLLEGNAVTAIFFAEGAS